MANIRFYLLEKSTESQAEYACRLAQKLLSQGQRLCWYHPELSRLQQLDELLWQLQPSSFIPHGINQPDAPICLSHQLEQVLPEHLLFNFADDAIESMQHLSQLIEIVENHEAAKQRGREKFKAYRRLGIEAKTFKV